MGLLRHNAISESRYLNHQRRRFHEGHFQILMSRRRRRRLRNTVLRLRQFRRYYLEMVKSMEYYLIHLLD